MKYELLRPCGKQFKDGPMLGQWGELWGYHFDGTGKWTEGQICSDCKTIVKKGEKCPKCGKECYGQHGGYDIVAPVGTLLKLPANGRALRAGWQDEENHGRGYGLSLVAQLDDPYELEDGQLVKPILTIGHLSELFIPTGSKLVRGTDFAYSGNSGNTSGPHVHLQLEIPGPYPRTPITFQMVEF